MDAIKKKMQAMKVEKDNAMDRSDVCEVAAKDAKARASNAEEEVTDLVKKAQQLEVELDKCQGTYIHLDGHNTRRSYLSSHHAKSSMFGLVVGGADHLHREAEGQGEQLERRRAGGERPQQASPGARGRPGDLRGQTASGHTET